MTYFQLLHRRWNSGLMCFRFRYVASFWRQFYCSQYEKCNHTQYGIIAGFHKENIADFVITSILSNGNPSRNFSWDNITDEQAWVRILLYWRYLGGARSKGFATLRRVSKLPFFYKIGQAKSVGFRFYSAIWRSESRISSRYPEITSISLIYSLTFSRKKELLFWLSLVCYTEPFLVSSRNAPPHKVVGRSVAWRH